MSFCQSAGFLLLLLHCARTINPQTPSASNSEKQRDDTSNDGERAKRIVETRGSSATTRYTAASVPRESPELNVNFRRAENMNSKKLRM